MSTLKRSKLVSEANLCYRCMNNHATNKCRSKKACMVCNGKHHSLLHCNNAASKSVQISKSFVVQQPSEVLLPTAVVKASTNNNKLVTLRALIDPGSQATLISANAAKQFNLTKRKNHIKISGVGGNQAAMCKRSITTTISPHSNGNFKLDIEALVFNNLPQQFPKTKIDTSKWTHLQQIAMADPDFNLPQPIDLIIGADYYPSIVKNNMIKGGPTEPMAQETELGYIVLGKINNINCHQKSAMMATRKVVSPSTKVVESTNIPKRRRRTKKRKESKLPIPIPNKPLEKVLPTTATDGQHTKNNQPSPVQNHPCLKQGTQPTEIYDLPPDKKQNNKLSEIYDLRPNNEHTNKLSEIYDLRPDDKHHNNSLPLNRNKHYVVKAGYIALGMLNIWNNAMS